MVENGSVARRRRQHVRGSRLPSLTAALWLTLASVAQAQSPPVSTTSGIVQGNARDANGITSFLGIPYAAPPVGDLRWRAPAAVPPTFGVRPALTLGAGCIPEFRPNASNSEDCLNLNVWTPDLSPAVLKPVMVYFPGGGFEFGSSADPRYDGSVLAQRDVVVVTVNYRLGVFGFLATTQLDQESGTSGAWGLLDQLAALRWVQQNIASFGGDPTRVTMFGESAGAHAVGLLLTSPRIRGLVSGAIMESGALWDSEHGSIATHAEELAIGSAYVQQFAGQDLRSIPAATLNAATNWNVNTDPGITTFAPSIDGDVLRLSPAEVFARGQSLNVPILAGWNAAEYTPFTARALPAATPEAFDAAAGLLFGSRCLPVVEALYPAGSAAQTQASSLQLDGDLVIAQQVWNTLVLSRTPGAMNAYAYNYTFTSPYSPVAAHVAEVPFVFGTINLTAQSLPATAPHPGAIDQQVSNLMMSYWSNFAHAGNPNGPGLPVWPVFTGVGSQVMEISATPGARANTDEARFRLIASFRSHGRLPETWRTLGASGSQYPRVNCGG